MFVLDSLALIEKAVARPGRSDNEIRRTMAANASRRSDVLDRLSAVAFALSLVGRE